MWLSSYILRARTNSTKTTPGKLHFSTRYSLKIAYMCDTWKWIMEGRLKRVSYTHRYWYITAMKCFTEIYYKFFLSYIIDQWHKHNVNIHGGKHCRAQYFMAAIFLSRLCRLGLLVSRVGVMFRCCKIMHRYYFVYLYFSLAGSLSNS